MKRIIAALLLSSLLIIAGCAAAPVHPSAVTATPQAAMAAALPSVSAAPSDPVSPVPAPMGDEPETISYQGITFALYERLEDVEQKLKEKDIPFDTRNTNDGGQYFYIRDEDNNSLSLSFNQEGALMMMDTRGLGKTATGMTTKDTWQRGIELYGDDYIWEAYNYKGHMNILEYQRDGYFISFSRDHTPLWESHDLVNRLVEGLFPYSIKISDASLYPLTDTQNVEKRDLTQLDQWIEFGEETGLSEKAHLFLGLSRNALEGVNEPVSFYLMKGIVITEDDDGWATYRFGNYNVDLFRARYDSDGRIMHIVTKHPAARTGRFLQLGNSEKVVKTLYGSNGIIEKLPERDAYFGSDRTITYTFHNSKLRIHMWMDVVEGFEVFY